MEREGLWKEIVESKYGTWREINVRNNPTKESWWWRDISKATNEVV